MKISAQSARYATAICAGLLLALSFPLVGIAGFAWLAPGLLLFAAGPSFRIGFVGGFAYYLASLYWLLHIPVTFLPIVGWIGLSAYLALFTGGWVWLCWRFVGSSAGAPQIPGPTVLKESSWLRRSVWTIQCAAAWVTCEIVIGRFLSGFPWDFLGVSQYRAIPLIQIAAFTGVYGVSFLIIWFSCALWMAIVSFAKTPQRWSREVTLPLLTILILSLGGLSRVRSVPPATNHVRMALIQPSIPQTLIWSESENTNRFQQLLQLSEQALTNKPDVLLWPEASVPNMLRHDRATADAVRDLATRHRVWIILGSDDAEQRPGGTMRDIDYFNSAFAINSEGELAGMYRKRQLVIFGEYMPFVRWLPFLRKVLPAGESGFTPGAKPVPFRLRSVGVTAGILICFEDTFPHVAREYVSRTTDFLVNLTNNGWFGESAAQWQHAATAVFRAVENRIPLVRCTNNGLTCWIDSTGVMHETYFPGSTDIYKVGYKLVTIPKLGPGESRALSFYTLYGDVFGWACCALTLLPLGRLLALRCAKRWQLAAVQ